MENGHPRRPTSADGLLLDALVGVPGALEFADVDDLADVVGVVGADVGDGVGPFC